MEEIFCTEEVVLASGCAVISDMEDICSIPGPGNQYEDSVSGVQIDEADGADQKLYKVLGSLKDSMGDFACSGFLPKLVYPGLLINNVGYVALPVQDEQAKKIIEVAKKAPFGLGTETLVDETVRKTWELEPSQIKIKNKDFIAGVEDVVCVVKKSLGCNRKSVKANLYKVLLYEKGGHFKVHRDTEKECGMFATMVIQLPSTFEGGKITVRHAGNEKVFEMDGERSAYCCKYTAHYSDCEHEVSEVTDGYRLALVYSLCWKAHGDAPSADTGPAVVRKVAKILPEICAGDRNLFCWVLSHKYSKSGLSGSGVNALKGADEAVARSLQQANQLLPEEQQFDFYIAEVNREVQQHGSFYRDRYWGDGEFEPDGDEEEEVNIENWIDFDGKPISLEVFKRISLDIENDVVNLQGREGDDAVEQFWGSPVSEDNTGPTGNCGATQTYWYNSYAIFAWQKDNEVNLRCKLNGYLSAVQWVSKKIRKVGEADTAYQNALSNVKILIDYAIANDVSLQASAVTAMLNTFASLRSEAVILANLFITDVLGKQIPSETSNTYYLGDGSIINPLADLVLALGWPSVFQSLKTLLDRSPVCQHKNWANFLKSLFEKRLTPDDCFLAMVASLLQKIEIDAQNNQLEPSEAKNRVESIASLLFAIDDAGLLAKFTTAIQAHCQQSPTSLLLQNLIRHLEKEKEKLCNNRFWNELLNRRIDQLRDVEKAGIPPFTWNQDDAVFKNSPQVQEFLRGPNRTTTHFGFTGIAQARAFACSYFDSASSPAGWQNWRARNMPAPPRSYSATATAVGTGRNAHVVIEKTRKWYDAKVAPVVQQMEELKRLRSMVNLEAVPASLSEIEQLEPQQKKRAIDVVCLD